MKAQVKFYRPVQENLVLVTYASSRKSGKTAHLRNIAMGPLQIALKRRDVDEGSVKFYKPVQESSVLNAYASSESLKKKGCRWRLRSKF